MTTQLIDTILIITTNLFNLIMVAIFLSRPAGRKRLEYWLGIANLALILPLAAGILFNLSAGREWWATVLPALLLAFLLLELLLDYILKLQFRQTRLLGPYLLLYYAAQMGMIGYAFLVSEPWGFVTLVTYFLCLGATAYSYRKVGHGR